MGKENGFRYRNAMARRELILSLSSISGAEDPPGGDPPPNPNPNPPTDPPTPPTDPPADPPAAPDKVWTKAEVDTIISESKAYRKRAQDAEKWKADQERAQLSEVDRLKAEAAEAKKVADDAQKQIAALTLQQHVITEASTQNFTTPTDVIAFLDTASIKLDDDGKPDTNSLKAAIKRLATDKPYLIKGAGGAGSADGGARGANSTSKEAEYEKEYQARGMVPVS